MAKQEIVDEVTALWDTARAMEARLVNMKEDYRAQMSKVHNFCDKFPELREQLGVPPRRTRVVKSEDETAEG